MHTYFYYNPEWWLNPMCTEEKKTSECEEVKNLKAALRARVRDGELKDFRLRNQAQTIGSKSDEIENLSKELARVKEEAKTYPTIDVLSQLDRKNDEINSLRNDVKALRLSNKMIDKALTRALDENENIRRERNDLRERIKKAGGILNGSAVTLANAPSDGYLPR